MKFGIRTPSLKKRISARTSLKRIVRHRMGIKAPKGMGIVTDPKKAIHNKIYNKTSVSVDGLLKNNKKDNKKIHGKEMSIIQKDDGSIDCPLCGKNMGNPITKGIFKKTRYYYCSDCKIKANIQ